MTLRTRRIIFYILAVLFLFSGGGVLLYAEGWRLDPQTFSPVKTGGIYIESVPRDAKILINGEPIRNTSGIISSGTLISGLLPRNYDVAVTKDGYSEWRKTLSVEPSLVTQAGHIILVPQKSAAVPLPVPARGLSVFRGALAVTFADGSITLGTARLPGTELFAVNGNGSAAVTFDGNRGSYLLVPLPDAQSAMNLSLLFNNLKERLLDLPGTVPPQEILPHPFDAQKVIVRTERGLYVLDPTRLTLTPYAAGTATIGAVFARGQTIFWTEYSSRSGESSLMTADLIIRTTNRLATVAGDIKEVEESPVGGFLLIARNGRLLLLSRGAKEAKVLEENTLDIAISPGGSRFIARLAGGTLALWDLKEPARRAMLPLVADEVIWHKDGAHIFARRGGAVSLIELFENGTVYEAPLSETAMAMAYDPSRNLFYLLEGGELRSLEL